MMESIDAHQPLDFIFSILWSKLDFALVGIRSKLNLEFRSRVDSAFERLEADLIIAKRHYPMLELMENIRAAHADFVASVDATAGWFLRASNNYLGASEVGYLIDIALGAFERVNSLQKVASVQTENLESNKLPREATKPFVIALINIFDNCFMHSGFGRATSIEINGNFSNGKTIIDISNKLTPAKMQLLTAEYVALINDRARSEKSTILVKSEGGSGTVKAFREVTNCIPDADVSFALHSEKFNARIEYVI